MIVVIDNFDSFVYNLARYVEIAGFPTKIVRNHITLNELIQLNPTYLIVSPGPCAPKQAGISIKAIEYFLGKIPILGVCLGHQALGEVLGGRIMRAKKPMHGKSSQIYHNQTDIFTKIPNPTNVGRYHSLIVDNLNDKISAKSAENEIMAISDIDNNAYGVQFHPESILTPYGQNIILNFFNANN